MGQALGYPRLASHAEKECEVNMNKVVAGDYEGNLWQRVGIVS